METTKETERSEKDEKLTFTITGMTCATCARTVEKAVSKIAGVKFVAVNLATSTGFVVAERPVTMDEIKAAVKSVGYGISTETLEEIETKRYLQSKRDLMAAWIITVPLAVLMIYHMFISKIPSFEILELFAGAFVIFFAGRRTITGAWIALTHRHTNMDTLIFFGASASWITTLLSILGVPVASFSTIGVMIVAFHLTGRFIESRLRDRAAKEIKALLKLQSKEARVITEKGEVMIPIEAVKEGFFVAVKPGERVPVDGEIAEGTSSVDESMITGESIPVRKTIGDEVVEGSLNLTGFLKVQVARVGEDTFLSQMIKLIQEAQGAKVPIQALADRITNWFVPTIILLATAGAILWYFQFENLQPFLDKAREFLPWVVSTVDPLSVAVFVFVATIVIACPCALGLATPMALVTGTGLAAKKGLIIRNAEVIQTSKDVKVVLMDKTGTITEGQPKVVNHSLSSEEHLIVAAIETRSNHPLAKAIVGSVDTGSPDFLNVEVENVEERVGEGVKATIKSHTYFIGKPENPEVYRDSLMEGKTVVEVRKDDKRIGHLVIEDPIREDSKEAVEHLKVMGIRPVMVTGDNEKTARAVALQVGIEEVHAGVKPSEKLDIVRRYQSEGAKVVMVGDGMNDAAALKGADVGIAMGSGTDLAIDSADIVITKGGVSKIVDAVEISRLTFKVIKQNLFWAFFYNVVAIPTAMMGLLHPVIAEVAMALSSITVVLNSSKISREIRRGGVEMKEYVLSVPDMSCGHCKMKISSALEELGAKEFSVDLDSKTVRVKTEDLEKIKTKLAKIEYPVVEAKEV